MPTEPAPSSSGLGGLLWGRRSRLARVAIAAGVAFLSCVRQGGARNAATDRPHGSRAEFPWGRDLAGIPRCPEAPEHPERVRVGEAAHVGVLLVHGVGSQYRGDTFRQSVGPLVRLLREAAFQGSDPLADPTRIASQALPGAGLPMVELDLPRSGSEARVHWVISEAWWAASFSPPDLTTMISWLGAQGGTATVARRLRSQRPRTDRKYTERRRFADIPLQVVISAGATVILSTYTVLRAIFALVPIGALRERLIGPIDRFLREWAGDMRVLLRDEAQAGMVRFGIGRAIRALQAYGCRSIVIVAHSGGAVASYMTLTDPTYQRLPVGTLITYGSGLNIAWRLLGFDAETPAKRVGLVGGGLGRKLRREVRWHDFWATDDPVCAGPVDEAPNAVSRPLEGVPAHAPGNRVNNRWNYRVDHGRYFENDEEFLIPLAEAIDDEVRLHGAPKLFSHWPEPDRAAAIARRLERVSALSLWRRFAATGGILAVFGAITAGLVRFWLDLPGGLTRPLGDITDYFEQLTRDVFGVANPETSAVATPTGEGVSNSVFDLAAALTLTGSITWIVVLAAAAFTLRPELLDWIRAWPQHRVMRVVVMLTSLFIYLVLVFTALFGIPGLLGLILESSPVWELPWFVWLRRAFLELSRDLGPAWGNAVMNFLVAIVLVAVSIIVLGVLQWAARRLRSSSLGSIAASVAVFAATAWVAVSVVFAVVVSGGFRANLTGWLLLLVTFSILNAVGQWRWSHWDEDERWEVRTAAAGNAKRRRAGRWLDAVVFTSLGMGAILASLGFALRPLWTDLANVTLVGAGLIILLAVFIGLAQDELNGRDDPLGTGPTAVTHA